MGITDILDWMLKHNIGLRQIQVFAIVANLALMITFSMLGVSLARKKQLNVKKWGVLCFIFHLWAYLVLVFAHPRNSK
jgi:hypothetical protein